MRRMWQRLSRHRSYGDWASRPFPPRGPQSVPFPLRGNGLLGELAGPDRLRFALTRPDRHPGSPPSPKPGRS